MSSPPSMDPLSNVTMSESPLLYSLLSPPVSCRDIFFPTSSEHPMLRIPIPPHNFPLSVCSLWAFEFLVRRVLSHTRSPPPILPRLPPINSLPQDGLYATICHISPFFNVSVPKILVPLVLPPDRFCPYFCSSPLLWGVRECGLSPGLTCQTSRVSDHAPTLSNLRLFSFLPLLGGLFFFRFFQT